MMNTQQQLDAVPVVAPGHTLASVTDRIGSIVLTGRTPRAWWLGFAVAFALVMLLNFAVTWLLVVGVGIWGINVPIAWGFAIVNFVWWIGIGHAGTLISAILFSCTRSGGPRSTASPRR
jgi:hypothetical protein